MFSGPVASVEALTTVGHSSHSNAHMRLYDKLQAQLHNLYALFSSQNLINETGNTIFFTNAGFGRHVTHVCFHGERLTLQNFLDTIRKGGGAVFCGTSRSTAGCQRRALTSNKHNTHTHTFRLSPTHPKSDSLTHSVTLNPTHRQTHLDLNRNPHTHTLPAPALSLSPLPCGMSSQPPDALVISSGSGPA